VRCFPRQGIVVRSGATQVRPTLVQLTMKTPIIIGLAMLATPAVSSRLAANESLEINFDQAVAPLLARRCLDCHSGPDPKGKLDLSRKSTALAGGESGPAIVPGKPGDSLLWERVSSDEMPPKSPLSQSEKTVLRAWLAAGANWGTDPIDPFQVTTSRRAGRDWWSLQPVRRPQEPAVRRHDWVRTPIDRFILNKLEANGLSPSPEADRRALIRRVCFQLTGLPPEPEEIDDFMRDETPGAYAKMLDRYLASPQYGVRWARWWLDLARYGESNGYEFDEFRPAAWRYRDWVIEALNRDRPYDEFARLQIAGDALRPTDADAIAATGFLVAGAYDFVGQTQQSQLMRAVVRSDEIEDLVGTVGQTFLGVTVNCARCHDHKFDPIRQEEYYGIASALSGVRHGERDLSSIDSTAAAVRKRIAELQSRVEAIEKPVREQILAGREKSGAAPPDPIAAWNFESGLVDLNGELTLTLEGGAKLTPEGLKFDGKNALVRSTPLKRGLSSKTIEAWLQLDNLSQRGGGVMTIQATSGLTFDSIVFGEQEPGRWMAGSEGFRRYQSVSGPIEQDAANRPVHFAITYTADGTIRLYRDGLPYGEPYKPQAPLSFAAGEAVILFGQRHTPAGGNRALAGTLMRARLYDRALAPREIAASAASFRDFIPANAITAALEHNQRAERGRILAEIERLRISTAANPRVYAVAPREAGAMHVEVRGNPHQPGNIVKPVGIAAIVAPDVDFGLKPDAPEARRRERLANWVCGPRNPLFARVVVNRLWQAHFGTGFVETASDFGFNGGRPSHPELLDWLASEIAREGWSLKAMQRLILTSAAFRQAARSDPAAVSRDAGNRLIWQRAPVRLQAEMVRDAMLCVAGALDTRLGGPSFFDHAVQQAPGTPAILYKSIDPGAPGTNRRTIFRAWLRGGRSHLLDAFDCPDPSTSAPRRAVTTTPLQALSMMNNALVLHLSEAFANRLVRENGDNLERQVDRAYRLALGRLPEPDERTQAVRVVERAGLPALTRAIFNCNEFLYFD
jgi:Protein of unknown function (DUF1549)/Protein of unknown function (DUF1553)/Planctomycete cytochrome C/Concanavalin A-like lectin/glucanases superfamily